MNSRPPHFFGWFGLVVAVFLPCAVAYAYPPAPYHTIYGMIRDEMGEPLAITDAEIVLETLAGVQVKAKITPLLAPGINYRLLVPMDAGLTADAYKPNALRPTVPFRMRVHVRQNTLLPMETAANFSNLGKPAQRTRMDLTLGEDSNGNGLPDAWERLLAEAVGDGVLPEQLLPEGDADGDGISNLSEYLAGTYAFDPTDGFRLNIAYEQGGRPVLEFLGLRGRTYAIEASTDLEQWTPVSFQLLSDFPDGPVRQNYLATDVRLCWVAVIEPGSAVSTGTYYRARVQ